jgi:tetratricopeptide (TPR) repeat protein
LVPGLVFAQAPDAETQRQKELARKPQYERMLTGEDAERVDNLSKAIQDYEESDAYPEAIQSAKELLALRVNAQGADHYEAVTAKFLVSRLEKLSVWTIAKRDRWRTAAKGTVEARSLEAEGHYDKAYPAWKRFSELCQELLGEDHPETATSYNNVAYNLYSVGKVAEALSLLQKALDIRRKVLSDDHPETARSFNGLGVALRAHGKAAEALPLLQEALNIRRKVMGDDHSETAIGYSNLAANLLALGKVAEAQLLLQKALDIRRKVMGEDHSDTAIGYNNLAMSLGAQGNYAQAAPLFEKALDIRRKVFGENHPDTSTSYNNLYNLENQGKAVEALPLYQNALDICREVLGENHPYTAQGYVNLAYNLENQGKPVEALTLYKKALDIRREVLGADHPETADSYNNLANALTREGRYAEAQPLCQKALDIHRKVLGDDHPDTANSYSSLAYSLDTEGKAAEARPLLQKRLDICRKALGVDHPDTADSYYRLACNLKALGDAGAEAVLRQAIFSTEASRLIRAQGIERAIGEKINPRLLLSVIEQVEAPLAAWANVEATLARGLLDQQRLTRGTLTPDEKADLVRWQDVIAKQQAQILELVTQSNRSEHDNTHLELLITERQEAGQKLAALAVTASTREVATNEEIKAALPADAALLLWVDVSFTGGVEEHFACVVRSSGEPKWERLPGSGVNGKWAKEDSLLPVRLRNELASNAPSQPTIDSLAQKLYAQRIAPVLTHLEGVKSLYVVGVQEMAGIPVSLLTPDYTISYVPSGTFLARRGKPLEKPATLLALGDPTFPAQEETTTPSALPPGGLLIKQVVPGGTAAKALLKPNDVLLSYARTKLESVEQLGQLVADKAGEKSVTIEIWREAANQTAVYEIAPGKLGVVMAEEPAREAIAARNHADQLLASVTRGSVWGELPGSQVEVSQLTKLFEPGNVTLLTRSEASEPELNELRNKGDLTSFRYLHFATHGEANNAKAFDSKLILAQDHPPQLFATLGEPWLNNELSAREVLDHWKLDADLVTLSACETAIGKSGGGDGMLGFAQAFLLAGSRSVCLSLWKVDDTATALLMDRFYRNLLGKREDGAQPMGKAAALHEARTWLRNLSLAEATDRLGVLTDGVSRGSKKGREVIGEVPIPKDSASDSKPYSHPKYWAAFILIGDSD